jgi:two-component system chemotaxis response regulator CheY
MRCLIVEDSITAKRILVRALKAAGCTELLEAADAEQALRLCDGAVSVAVINWNLVGGALELVGQLRSRPECAGLRIIVTTTRSSRSDVVQAMEAGVDHYLLKPFTADALRARILDLVSERSGQPVR